MAKYKIAIIQLYPKPYNIDNNHARAVARIREASSRGVQLAVLPEFHLGELYPPNPDFRNDCKNWKQYLDAYRALARECHICIVPGSFAELHVDAESGEEKLVNATYFINHHGDICGRYEKKNLWHPEREHVQGSKNQPHIAFDTPLGKVGMLICWDLAFPEAFRELISQGAKIIIVPAYWKLTDPEIGVKRNPLAEQIFLDSVIVSRTYENTCAVVFCNAAGPAEEGFAGLSQAAVPFLGSVGRLATSDEGMGIVELDMSLVEDAELDYKVREDMASSDWHYQSVTQR
ncbi:hypothetical protein EYZ11_005966 [Aspergillus tanneri]|uniref:CN hydrolase domain-containing protein n=1 Tax=Aspergillus tanneri TaxID=1220188 RepID=A0A4S3JJ06_9EURO|nr:uncharacterized protein ATNIH1004_002259 [Aspergillus tanneri]KAA8649588.1 hypothetical protein ATNIH1004_002259 [Aspergillus tanneri]THC94567.1 hypothetical protein EYZ11_005966 [Aspergillus tanneri]